MRVGSDVVLQGDGDCFSVEQCEVGAVLSNNSVGD